MVLGEKINARGVFLRSSNTGSASVKKVRSYGLVVDYFVAFIANGHRSQSLHWKKAQNV